MGAPNWATRAGSAVFMLLIFSYALTAELPVVVLRGIVLLAAVPLPLAAGFVLWRVRRPQTLPWIVPLFVGAALGLGLWLALSGQPVDIEQVLQVAIMTWASGWVCVYGSEIAGAWREA